MQLRVRDRLFQLGAQLWLVEDVSIDHVLGCAAGRYVQNAAAGIAAHAREEGKTAEADAVTALIEEILARPEHAWFEQEKRAEP